MAGPKKKKATAPHRRKAAAGKPKALKPVRLTRKDIAAEQRDEGPGSWFLATIESSYTRLASAGAPPRSTPSAQPSGEPFASVLHPGQDETVLAELPATFWVDLLKEYKARKAAQVPVGGKMTVDQILQRGRDKEIFLTQA